jgi:hypothetical protein
LEEVRTSGETDDDSDNEDQRTSLSSLSSTASKEGEERTVESMDSQDFLNQHNDFCDVCNEGGDLLCCTTCSLVFHLKCVRPTLEKLPTGDWSCPHCIISGLAVVVQGKEEKQALKKNSKAWKAAAAGVRQMGRLRKAARSKKEADDKNDSEADDGSEEDKANMDDRKHSSSEETEFHRNTASEADETKKSAEKPKKNMELFKIRDSFSPSLKVENNNASVRVKRPRKPVTLYDPQNCPASEWQSDEQVDRLLKSEPSKQEEEKSGDDDLESVASVLKRKRKSGDAEGSNISESENDDDDSATKWCKFCKDDSNIPLCVFCACRVCFGKHDKAKTLLCDKCDEEYHSYCLDPPLASIPKGSKKWFCPSCDTTESSPKQHKTRRTSAPMSTPKASGTPTSTAFSEKGSSTGRPRGRPPKNSPSNTTPTPRKRGRPPKSASSTPSTLNPTPRKRGRPPKNLTPTDDSKKRASSPDALVDTSSHKKARATITSVETKSPASSTENDGGSGKKSRSGRMLKRSSFHDERDEGEQHLRSSRAFYENALSTETVSTTSRDAEPGESKNSDDTDPPKAAQDTETPPAVPNNTVASTPAVEEEAKPDQPMAGKSQLPPPPPVITAAAAISKDGNNLPSTDVRPPGPPSISKQSPITIPTSAPTLVMPKEEKDVLTNTALPVKIEKLASLPSSLPQGPPARPNQGRPLTSAATAIPVQKGSEEKLAIPAAPLVAAVKKVAAPSAATNINAPALAAAAMKSATAAGETEDEKSGAQAKVPRRKPGARECMQISRRFGVRVIPERYMDTLLDYCTRGKVEHLIRMRERLDEHSRFLESQLGGLEALVREKGESDAVVPPLPDRPDNKPHPSPAR